MEEELKALREEVAALRREIAALRQGQTVYHYFPYQPTWCGPSIGGITAGEG